MPDNRSENGNGHHPVQKVYTGTLDDTTDAGAEQEWSVRAESWGVDAVDDDPWSAEFVLTLVTDHGDRVNCVLPLNNTAVTSDVHEALSRIAQAQGIGTSAESGSGQGWLAETRQQDPYTNKFEKSIDPLRIRQLTQTRGGLALVGGLMAATVVLVLVVGLFG